MAWATGAMASRAAARLAFSWAAVSCAAPLWAAGLDASGLAVAGGCAAVDFAPTAAGLDPVATTACAPEGGLCGFPGAGVGAGDLPGSVFSGALAEGTVAVEAVADEVVAALWSLAA